MPMTICLMNMPMDICSWMGVLCHWTPWTDIWHGEGNWERAVHCMLQFSQSKSIHAEKERNAPSKVLIICVHLSFLCVPVHHRIISFLVLFFLLFHLFSFLLFSSLFFKFFQSITALDTLFYITFLSLLLSILSHTFSSSPIVFFSSLCSLLFHSNGLHSYTNTHIPINNGE